MKQQELVYQRVEGTCDDSLPTGQIAELRARETKIKRLVKKRERLDPGKWAIPMFTVLLVCLCVAFLVRQVLPGMAGEMIGLVLVEAPIVALVILIVICPSSRGILVLISEQERAVSAAYGGKMPCVMVEDTKVKDYRYWLKRDQVLLSMPPGFLKREREMEDWAEMVKHEGNHELKFVTIAFVMMAAGAIVFFIQLPDSIGFTLLVGGCAVFIAGLMTSKREFAEKKLDSLIEQQLASIDSEHRIELIQLSQQDAMAIPGISNLGLPKVIDYSEVEAKGWLKVDVRYVVTISDDC